MFGLDRFLLKHQILSEDNRDEEPTHGQQTGGSGVVKTVCNNWYMEITNDSLLEIFKTKDAL